MTKEDFREKYGNTSFIKMSDVPSFLELSDYSYLFEDFEEVEFIDFSGMQKSNLPTNMEGMFLDCISLKHIDISMFSTEKITSFEGLFDGCSSLEVINLSNVNQVFGDIPLELSSEQLKEVKPKE